MDSGLRDKVVLVTGGSGGIGQAFVGSFVDEGAHVIIHYNSGKERASQLLDSIAKDRAAIVQANLQSDDQVVRLFDESEAALSPIDVLIANAGKWPEADTPIHEMRLQRWKETMDVNATSIFLCVREFVKRSIARSLEDPAIVVTGSTAGRFGEAGHGDYASAKSSFMNGLVQSLKNEITRVAARGRINAVCPGWTLTPMARSLTKDTAAMKRALQTIPLRKFASSEDIANSVLFLASNKLAGHITGQALFVDGGMEGRVINSLDEIDLDRAIPK